MKTAEMSTAQLKAFHQGRVRTGHKRITNNPKTWPSCDRPLTPAEKAFEEKLRDAG